MVVTASAADRQPQPGRADRHRAIDDLFDAVFFQVGAALAVTECVSQKARGEELIGGRARQ